MSWTITKMPKRERQRLYADLCKACWGTHPALHAGHVPGTRVECDHCGRRWKRKRTGEWVQLRRRRRT